MLSELSIVCKCDSCDLNYASLLSNIRSGIQFHRALEKISGHRLKSDSQKRRGEERKERKAHFSFFPIFIKNQISLFGLT